MIVLDLTMEIYIASLGSSGGITQNEPDGAKIMKTRHACVNCAKVFRILMYHQASLLNCLHRSSQSVRGR